MLCNAFALQRDNTRIGEDEADVGEGGRGRGIVWHWRGVSLRCANAIRQKSFSIIIYYYYEYMCETVIRNVLRWTREGERGLETCKGYLLLMLSSIVDVFVGTTLWLHVVTNVLRHRSLQEIERERLMPANVRGRHNGMYYECVA